MSSLLRFALCACLALIAPLCLAQIPPAINYQGFLTNPSGTPINSNVPMTFRLYDVATGGTPLWTEIQPNVSVVSGNFNVTLGAYSALTSLNFDVPYWLTVQIDTDVELLPRQAMQTVPYAATAAALDSGAQVPGSQISGPITSATIGGTQINGPITNATIGSGQITGVINAATAVTATTATTATSLSGTITGSQITGDIIAPGNLRLANSTAGIGNIFKGPLPFLHNFGSQSTFAGEDAGNFTQTGSDNTALGALTLQAIADGFNNTAAGSRALRATTSGFQNSAFGASSLIGNTGGNNNSALGFGAMLANVGGGGNTAIGTFALQKNTAGSNNTAIGMNALDNNTGGNDNIALGRFAGSLVTAGSKNIHIGHVGSASDANTIRIGLSGDQSATFIAGVRGTTIGGSGLQVLIDPNGQLGVATSTRTVKDAIADMGEASDILMKLRPVTFHYRGRAGDDAQPLQYGLIAEEVAEVAPGLVAHSTGGKIETVYYQHLPPMLLNEYQKQQRTIRAQAAELAAQRIRMEALARELQDIKSLLAGR